MNVAMMQPAFLPWQGFFELVYRSDIFIILDDFQFSVQSRHQRNRLFVNKGQVDWYSVPVLKSESFKSPLNQTKINESTPWREKMWKRIQQNYSKTPYYPQIAPPIEKWLLGKSESLAAQNIAFTKIVCDLLALKPEFRYSSQHPSEQSRSQRVLELLRWCQAKRYYCAKGSFPYMLEDGVFPLEDIEVLFQDFQAKAYNQRGAIDSFVPNLSVLDALFNVGPEQTAELIKNGTPQWLTWVAMIQKNSAADGNNEAVPEEDER